MTADGATRLRRSVDEAEEPDFTIVINKLIVGSIVTAGFVQFVGRLADSIEFLKYHDAVFPLPSNTPIKQIIIATGSRLRIFSAGKNNFLKTLSVGSSLFTSLPASLSNLKALQILYINNCPITVVRMDDFSSNSQLEHVDLSNNKIRQVLPSTANERKTYIIHRFDLSSNQLDHLDMDVFASMPKLRRLSLTNNIIFHVDFSVPQMFPSLSELHLNDNLLEDVTKGWPEAPKLITLYIQGNNIRQLDLSVLQPNKNLIYLMVHRNQLRTLRASKPLRLANLELLDAESNNITSVNFALCDFPNITSISLNYNRLKTIPPIFVRFPKVVLTMHGNPLLCRAIEPFKNQIADRRLFLRTISHDSSCSTTSSITINEDRKVCCDV